MPKTPPHFDDLEIRDPKQREHELLRALRAQIDLVKAKSSTYARQLAEIESSSIGELSDFARLPLTKKADLKLMQKGSPPFGGLTTVPVSELPDTGSPERIRMSSWLRRRSAFLSS